MKSLFSRLRHRDTPPSSRPSSASLDKINESSTTTAPSTHTHRSSSYSTTSSIDRSSTPIAALHSQSSSSSSSSTRPHSIHEGYRDPGEGGERRSSASSSSDASHGEPHTGDDTIRGIKFSETEEDGVTGVKKVTFRSPIPTPTTSLVLDDTALLPGPTISEREKDRSTSTSYNQPARSGTSPTKDIRGRPLPQSRTSSRQSTKELPKPIITRKPSLPPLPNPSAPNGLHHPSIMSPTPSEESSGGASSQSYLPPPNSWSEMAEDDLIANLGPRERTRQEVLWEIVSSEERYVQELIKLNETFCRRLLPPSATSPSLNLFDPSATLARTLSPSLNSTPGSPVENPDFLPIAAKYASMSPSSMSTPASNPRMNAYNALTSGRPGEPSRALDNNARKASMSSISHGRGGPSGKHHSLPPPAKNSSNGTLDQKVASGQKNRMSYHPGTSQFGRFGRGNPHETRHPSGSSTSSVRSMSGNVAAGKDAQLPEDLEKVLVVLAGGILEGHLKLAAALRKRYENQYPLVRSLADVFTAHSYILREYATYILHLESALSQVDEALQTYSACHATGNKRSSKRMEDTDLGRLGKALMALEEVAAERGESGLVISLSKPFQRLLKYPLLFQNLLFNTDPSLKEYEATLNMVDEVEEIVRTIEDEKASSEEREKTRDVWARIDGLDKDKLLMAPKATRLLVSEIQQAQPDGQFAVPKDATKNRKSLKRLSEILKGHGEAVDYWVIRFSDVSLLCERTGVTHLPVSTLKSTTEKNESVPDRSSRRVSTSTRRGGSVRARNLYKFVKVHEWHLRPKTGSTEALLRMEDISEARSKPDTKDANATPTKAARPSTSASSTPLQPSDSPVTPRKTHSVPLKGDGGPSPQRTPRSRQQDVDTDTVVSDGRSVMSFAFKGADQIKPTERKVRPAGGIPTLTAQTGILGDRKTSGPWPQRRVSAGPSITGSGTTAGVGQSNNSHSAKFQKDKFAHRLRSPDLDHGPDSPTGTTRPASRTRTSLPPAMARQSLHPANSGFATVNGKSAQNQTTRPLSPNDRIVGNVNIPRPAWNSSTKVVTEPKGQTPRLSNTASIASIRTARSGMALNANTAASVTSVRGTVPRKPRPPLAKAEDGGVVGPSGSEVSGVAGLWTAYRDGGAVGGETPVKRPVGKVTLRNMGGKI